MLNIVLMVGATVFAGLTIWHFSKKPRSDREWSPPLAEVAHFEETATYQYDVKNVRAWEYGLEGALRKAWLTQSVNAEQLSEIWFFVEPFTGNPLFAHSFLSFVFEDDNGQRNTLSVSVEARKEANEPYSAVKGAFRKYELLYVWSTEKDVLTRIAVKLDHTLYAYKLDLEQEKAMVIFDHFVQRTNELADKPRFYNTLHSNCTNELAKAVNDAFPGALPWHRSWVATGRSAKWLHKLGFIGDKHTSFDAITAKADIQPFVKTHSVEEADAFDDLWRHSMTGTAQ